MDGNQTIVTSGRGGKREGAGRQGLIRSTGANPQYLKARGINPLKAAEILANVIDERRAWQRVFKSQDDRIVLQGLMFLVSMRDGKPAQQINVTSTSLHLNPGDLERARAIVAEIRGDLPQTLISQNGLDTPRLGQGDTEPCNSCAKPEENVESESQHNAAESRGGNAGGR